MLELEHVLEVLKNPREWTCQCGQIHDRECFQCEALLCDDCDKGTFKDECSLCNDCKETYEDDLARHYE